MNGQRTATLARLALVAAIVAALSACAGPRWGRPGMGAGPRGPVAASQGWGGPGMMGGRGMRGYGPGMMGGYGYGPGMMGGYGPGMMGGYGPGTGAAGGPAGSSMLRHRQAMAGGIPSAYADRRDPLPASRDVIAAGERLYESNCATCHGSGGAGDGPAAAGMSPPPANLRWTVQRPVASDGYLMWAISDGGAQLGTGMPAFAGALSEKDRWRIIRYLRTL
jgi:mono/diheme cytochrome c family protein